MNPDIQFLVSVWDTIKHYVPKKDRMDAAEHLVRVFDEEADLGNIEDEVNTFDSILDTFGSIRKKKNFSVDETDMSCICFCGKKSFGSM